MNSVKVYVVYYVFLNRDSIGSCFETLEKAKKYISKHKDAKTIKLREYRQYLEDTMIKGYEETENENS
jgi:hypothetical protein